MLQPVWRHMYNPYYVADALEACVARGCSPKGWHILSLCCASARLLWPTFTEVAGVLCTLSCPCSHSPHRCHGACGAPWDKWVCVSSDRRGDPSLPDALQAIGLPGTATHVCVAPCSPDSVMLVEGFLVLCGRHFAGAPRAQVQVSQVCALCQPGATSGVVSFQINQLPYTDVGITSE